MVNPRVPQQPTTYHSRFQEGCKRGLRTYYDPIGRSHSGMTVLEALERRNRTLQRELVIAVEENLQLRNRVRELEQRS